MKARSVRTLRALIGTATLLATSTAAGHASADEATEVARGDARALMREGNSAYASGFPKLAEVRYLSAWKKAQGFDIACNLGRVSLELRHTRQAAQFLSYCLDHYSLSSREEVVQAEQEIRAAFQQARASVGELRLESTPGAEILVDGESLGHAPLPDPLYVEPGEHRVEASLAGYSGALRTLTLDGGGSQKVSLELTRLPEPKPEASPPRAERRALAASYVPSLVTGGLAVAGLAVGTGFFVAALSRASARDQQLDALGGSDPCGAGTPHVAECARIHNLSDDARAFRATSFVAFGVGAAGAAAAYFLWPRTPSRERSARVAPLVGPGGAGLAAFGTF